MKYFNSSTNDEIKSKINDVRLILSRLGNIVTKNDRKKIRKERYEIEKRQNLLKNEKEKIYDDLVKLANTLDEKKEHKHSDRDDLDYFGIRELEKLFDDIDDDNYYKPVLIRSSFEENYKRHESRGDEDKKLSVKQYCYSITPYLSDLINYHKNIKNSEWKIELNIGVNFISINNTGEIRTLYVNSDNEEIRLGNEIYGIIDRLVESFLSKYQNEKKY